MSKSLKRWPLLLGMSGILALSIPVSSESSTLRGLCVVSKVDGRVVFSKLSHRWKWTRDAGPPREVDVPGIEVWTDRVGSGDFLWAVDAKEGPLQRAITYGEAPAGYLQRFPLRDAEPEKLKTGRIYGINCGMGGGRFSLTVDGVVNLDEY